MVIDRSAVDYDKSKRHEATDWQSNSCPLRSNLSIPSFNVFLFRRPPLRVAILSTSTCIRRLFETSKMGRLAEAQRRLLEVSG